MTSSSALTRSSTRGQGLRLDPVRGTGRRIRRSRADGAGPSLDWTFCVGKVVRAEEYFDRAQGHSCKKEASRLEKLDSHPSREAVATLFAQAGGSQSLGTVVVNVKPDDFAVPQRHDMRHRQDNRKAALPALCPVRE